MDGAARLLLPSMLLSACGGANAFKLVIDGNTMAASDLRKVATRRLAANGSYSIFANWWNATGTNEHERQLGCGRGMSLKKAGEILARFDRANRQHEAIRECVARPNLGPFGIRD